MEDKKIFGSTRKEWRRSIVLLILFSITLVATASDNLILSTFSGVLVFFTLLFIYVKLFGEL